jgi:hypothetical protein
LSVFCLHFLRKVLRDKLRYCSIKFFKGMILLRIEDILVYIDEGVSTAFHTIATNTLFHDLFFSFLAYFVVIESEPSVGFLVKNKRVIVA